jgi:hypothetical protein
MTTGWLEMKSSSSLYLLLLGILLLGLFLRIGAAIRFPNTFHADEIFQTQEPAHRLAYGYGIITWEWRRGVRSWVYPAFLAGGMRATAWMGTGSEGYVRGIAIVLSLLSLTTIWFGFAWAKRASGTEAAIIAAGACAAWYELVYFGPKTLTEIMATNALLPGLYLGMYGEGLGEKRRMLLAGVFCGLAMSIRIQLAPAVGFAALYFWYPNRRQRTLPLAVGLLLPVLGFGLVDMITWAHPFQSYINYIRANLYEGRRGYGVSPWYWYLEMLCVHLGPIAFLVLMGLRRSPFLGWVSLIILLTHNYFGHKEVRFLYPMVPLEITLAALGIMELMPAFNARRKKPLSSRVIVAGGLAFCVVSSCLLIQQFDWSRNSGNLAAFDRLSRDPTLCGVAVYGIGWYDLGGYAHLHKNVPILILKSPSEFEDQSQSFNAFITPGNLGGNLHGFEMAGCSGGVCVYRRQGPCTQPRADNEINWVLWLNGS